MDTNVKNMPMRILTVIAGPKLTDKAVKLYQEENLPIQLEWNAKGTASSEMMDILGLGNSEKRILMSILPKKVAEDLLVKLRTELKLGTVNSGIAFTMQMSGVSGQILKLMENLNVEEGQEQKKKEDFFLMNTKYSLITVIVNQGYGEEVMDAARECGATGGTVVHSRRIGDTEVTGFWGVHIQEEKEMLFIVADEDSKLAIMQNVSEKCGISTQAQGMILSLPIETVVGVPN